jgi:hypothetical protein
MINDLLNMILPDRTLERDVDTFRRGLNRLLQPRPSDNDPTNRSLPKLGPLQVQ